MFKSKLVAKNKNFLGGKDRKKLIVNIKNSLNVENEEELEELLSKDDTVICKIPNSKNIIYISKEIPVFFCVNNNTIVPTLYTLWKLPKLIPCFVIYPPASEYLLRGADLMIPGVCTEIEQKEKLKAGSIWGVRVFNNPHIFAVGQCLVDYENTKQFKKLKGKCLKLMHVFHDELWKMGNQSIPDKSFRHNIIDSVEEIIDDFKGFKIYEIEGEDNIKNAQQNKHVEKEEKEEKEENYNEKNNTSSFGWGSDEENVDIENEKEKNKGEKTMKNIRSTDKYLENFYKHLEVIKKNLKKKSVETNETNKAVNNDQEQSMEAEKKKCITKEYDKKREVSDIDFDAIEKNLNFNAKEEMLYQEMLKSEVSINMHEETILKNHADDSHVDETNKKKDNITKVNLEICKNEKDKEENTCEKEAETNKAYKQSDLKEVKTQEGTEEKENTEEVIEESEEEKEDINKNNFVLNAAQQDTLLLYLLLEVLHTLNDNQLPMEFSGVYSRMNTECCYIHRNELFLAELNKNNVSCECIKKINKNEIKLVADIKKSSYKKLAKFIQHCMKIKLIKIKEKRNVIYLTNICRENSLFSSYIPVQATLKKKIDTEKNEMMCDKGQSGDGKKENEKDKNENKGVALNKGIQVLEFWMPTTKTLTIFKHVDAKTTKSSYFNINQIKDIFKTFLKSENLINEKQTQLITINETLKSALSIDNDAKELPYDQVLKMFTSTLQPCHSVIKPFTNFDINPLKVIKGICPSIHIYAVARMGGSKWVTHITNLSYYYLDLNKMCDNLQKQLACSCTVAVSPSTKKDELLVQGNAVNKISHILITQFNLPKKYIVLNSKGT